MSKVRKDLPFAKNDSVVLEISDLGSKGEGIGRFEGFAVFTEGALPGETVRVRIIKISSSYAVGKLEEILTASYDRVEPPCPYASQCGGCQLAHLSYEAQLRCKSAKIRSCLERIGGFSFTEEIPVLGMKEEELPHYRNKAQYPVQFSDGRARAGFYAARSHRLLEVSECFIQSERANQLIHDICEELNRLGVSVYDEASGKGLLRHVLIRTSRDGADTSVTFVINGKKLPDTEAWTDFMKSRGVRSFSLNLNREEGNVILGYTTLTVFGDPFIEDTLDGLSFRIAPAAFYQVNPLQTDVLYAKALEFAGLSGSETVVDAYCGIGTISLFLARHAGKVIGVEIVPDAIDNARENAVRNGIGNAEFFCGKSEELVPDMVLHQGLRPDIMVVDPPRAGCDSALLDAVCTALPEKLVYVSCDPATLARDLDFLCHQKKAYRLTRVCGVDMFPMTAHIETIVLLQRENS